MLDEDQLPYMRSSGVRNPEAFIAYQKSIEFNSAAHDSGGAEQLAGLLVTNKFLERANEVEPGFSWAHFDHADYYLHFVMDAALQDDFADGAIDEALELAEKDLRNAIRTAKKEGDRLGATLELVLVSGQWRRLPELLSAVYESSDCAYIGFWGAIGPDLDPSDEVLAFWQRALECDPLNYYQWARLAREYCLAKSSTNTVIT